MTHEMKLTPARNFKPVLVKQTLLPNLCCVYMRISKQFNMKMKEKVKWVGTRGQSTP